MNFQVFKLDLEKAEEPEIKLPTSVGSSKNQENARKTSTSALLITPKPLCTSQQAVENSSRDGNTRPPYLPPVGQEATVRTGHGRTDWFQIEKGVRHGCILSPYLFNLYAVYIMRNARLDEAQDEIKIAGRNINNLRYADDTTLIVERKKKRTKEPLDEYERGE